MIANKKCNFNAYKMKCVLMRIKFLQLEKNVTSMITKLNSNGKKRKEERKEKEVTSMFTSWNVQKLKWDGIFSNLNVHILYGLTVERVNTDKVLAACTATFEKKNRNVESVTIKYRVIF